MMNYDQFIEKVGNDKQFMKILRNDMTHYNFTYKEGLNEDILPFNPSGSCEPGGLYFTTIDHIHEFFDCGDHIAFITLCPDAVFYIDPEGNKFKTDKFNIDKIMLFSDCDNYYEICCNAVTHNGMFLHYVSYKHRTHDICLIAIKQDFRALEYVLKEHKTLELCTLAVKEYSAVLIFVPDHIKKIICSD